MPTELARVSAAERMQLAADRAALLAQHHGTVDADRNRDRAESTVLETAETEGRTVDADAHGRNAPHERNHDGGGKAGETAGPSPDVRDLKVVPEALEQHSLDIKV
jgi:hypothetical protein